MRVAVDCRMDNGFSIPPPQLNIMERIEHLFDTPLTNNIALFAFMLAILLIVPIVMRKLHLPQVIGLILCGVVIGPHALHLVDNTGAVSLFSTIGILYIMFTAGLELDLNQFKVNRNKSLLFGLLTWLMPLCVIFPVAFWGYGLSPLQSFLVGSMFGTHTLIAYPAVSRIGVARDPVVAVSVGGTILVDAFVLILLSVILGLASGELSFAFWLHLFGSLAVFTAVMFLVVPRIGEWFFKHWHNEQFIRYIFILFMMFFSALVAEICGMEGIIGAFMAGLVLNRMIPRSSSLMHNIEFVGNAIFIPFFLVTVGMLVDIGVILQGPETIILALILSAAALLGKFLAALIMQKTARYSAAQRNVMFGLSSARVAATLAVGLVAYRAGLIDVIFLNASILLILITSIVGSLATEHAAKRLAAERSDHTHHHASLADERILVPIANPAHAKSLIAFAELIHAPESAHRTTLLSVVPDDAHAESAIRSFTQALNADLRTSGNEAKMRISTTIDPSLSEGIGRVAREQLATLLLLGWPRSGLTDKIIGERWKSVVHNLRQLIIWADLPAQLTTPKRIALFTLPHAELEWGFDDWVDKIIFLAEQTSLPITHFGTQTTDEALRARLAATKQTITPEFIEFHLFHANRAETVIRESDWIVVVSARPGTPFHDTHCEHLPDRMSQNFTACNKLLIYPAQSPDYVNVTDEFEEV